MTQTSLSYYEKVLKSKVARVRLYPAQDAGAFGCQGAEEHVGTARRLRSRLSAGKAVREPLRASQDEGKGSGYRLSGAFRRRL